MFNKEIIQKFSRKYKAGQNIFSEGEFGREMFIILQGQIEIYRETEGKKKSLAVMGKGDIFGEMSLIDNFPRSACAVAVTDSILLAINNILFKKLIDNNLEFAKKIIKMLVIRIRNTNDIVINLYKKDRKEKIISALNEFYFSLKGNRQLKVENVIPLNGFLLFCENEKFYPKNMVVKYLKLLKEEKKIDFSTSSQIIKLINIDRRKNNKLT